jgi:hypothetical protein
MGMQGKIRQRDFLTQSKMCRRKREGQQATTSKCISVTKFQGSLQQQPVSCQLGLRWRTVTSTIPTHALRKQACWQKQNSTPQNLAPSTSVLSNDCHFTYGSRSVVLTPEHHGGNTASFSTLFHGVDHPVKPTAQAATTAGSVTMLSSHWM